MWRRSLVAKKIKKFRAGSNESNSRRGAGSGQCGIFREKTVARVNGIDISLFRKRHDPIDIEISLNRSLALTDKIGFVSLESMQTKTVFIGIHGGGADLQFIGGAENANGNFSAIQGQKFFDRHQSEFFRGFSPFAS